MAKFEARSAALPPPEGWQDCGYPVLEKKAAKKVDKRQGDSTCGLIRFEGGHVTDASDGTKHFHVQLKVNYPLLEAFVRMTINYKLRQTAGAVCTSQMSYQVKRGTRSSKTKRFHQLTDVHIPGGKTISQIYTFGRNSPTGDWQACGNTPPPADGQLLQYDGCLKPVEVGMQLQNGYQDQIDQSPGITTFCGANVISGSDGLGWCRFALKYKP